MPSVLFVSQYFAPKNEIASIRMVNLARGLVRLGWTVDVLTVEANLANPLERNLDLGIDVTDIPGLRIVRAPVPRSVGLAYKVRLVVSQFLGWRFSRGHDEKGGRGQGVGGENVRPATRRLSSVVRRAALWWIDRAYVRAFSRASSVPGNYDACVVSFGPRYMVDVAREVGARFPDSALVIDVRDPIVRPGHALSEHEVNAQRSTELLAGRIADGLVVVGAELIGEEVRAGVPYSVIPNGFSEEETSLATSRADSLRSRSKVRLFYGGRLYAQQSLSSLVAVCGLLETSIDVEVHYAGPDSDDFIGSFRANGLSHLVVDHGRVSRSESLRLALEADVAVVLSWNTVEKGVMTGKVYELIAVDVPILTLVVGDHENSALAREFSGDKFRRVFDADGDQDEILRICAWLREVVDDGAVVSEEFVGGVRYARFGYGELVREMDLFLRALIC